jgi:hypothetical protein
VINQWYEDAADFDKQYVGNRLEIFNGVVEVGSAVQRFRVRIKVFQ